MDKILLGILWLLVATLFSCFWFSVRFGFNLFSGAHWKYLAGLQAGQTAIQPEFYASMIVCTVVTLVGLYIIMRPRFRRIKLNTTPAPTPEKPTVHQPTNNTEPMPTLADATPAPATTSPTPNPDISSQLPLHRPMRPNVARPTSFDIVPPPTLNNATPTKAPTAPDYTQLREIFSDAGYTVKKAPARIDGIPIALLAIGTDEELWLGGANISTDDIQRATNKLSQVFSDTLDDIVIHIHGFVISASDRPSDETEILTFANEDELKEFMSSHHNKPLDDEGKENFDAYSEYIDTVIEYIGKA